MLRNRSCVVVESAYLLSGMLLIALVDRASALELSIIESGPEGDTTVGLWVDDLTDSSNFVIVSRVNKLVSPSGDVLTPSSILQEGNFWRDLLLEFDSVTEAFDYVDGTWQATLSPFTHFLDPPLSDEFEFTIDGDALGSINRVAPSLLSPVPGKVIKNASTFEFGWDYVTDQEPPNRSIYYEFPQFDPVSSGGRAILDTPTPEEPYESSGFAGGFSSDLVSVPGTNQNRFLSTFKVAGTDLPLDVELTLGSYISPDNVLTLGDTIHMGLSSPPEVNFFYSRENDPFFITLSTVPEPGSLALTFVLATCCYLLWSRWATHH